MWFSVKMLLLLWSYYSFNMASNDTNSDLWDEVVDQNNLHTSVNANLTSNRSTLSASLPWSLWTNVLRPVLGGLLLILTWSILNTWRLVKEKRRAIKREEHEAYERYVMVKEICSNIEKIERANLRSTISKNKTLHYKRKTLRKTRKHDLLDNKFSKVWNKLHQQRLAANLKEKVVYEKNTLVQENVVINRNSTQADPIHSCSEISAFVPQFQSTNRNSEIKTKMSDLSPEEAFKSAPFTVQMLNESKLSSDMYDPHPGLLAPNDVLVADHFASTTQPGVIPSQLPNSGVFGCNYFDTTGHSQMNTRDSGYHDVNELSHVTSSDEEMKLREILHQLDEYNVIKNVELHDKMREVELQVKSEMEDLKSTFRLPPEDVQLSRSLIHDCPPLKLRKNMLHQVNQKIKLVQNEIKVMKKNSLKLSCPSETTFDDSLSRLKLSLVWQQKHDERFDLARSKIIRFVKSAMGTRFRGMAALHKSGPKSPNGKNCCYDCASGRHKWYFVDGVDGCVVEGNKILSECDGFSEECTVVKVINSWYNDLGLTRCSSTKDRADRMESLLNKVLKEMYVKRYYERGQLVSQVYLTVSSDLHLYVRISPKSSIPASDD